MSTPVSEEKFRMHVDHGTDDGNRLINNARLFGERRSWDLKSLILPLLLLVLLVTVTVLSVLIVTRRNTCRQQQLEQAEALLGYKPDGHVSEKKSKEKKRGSFS